MLIFVGVFFIADAASAQTKSYAVRIVDSTSSTLVVPYMIISTAEKFTIGDTVTTVCKLLVDEKQETYTNVFVIPKEEAGESEIKCYMWPYSGKKVKLLSAEIKTTMM